MPCNIDHSLEDVRAKLQTQADFMPQDLLEEIQQFLNESLNQIVLNDIFHLLKKYDLSDSDEKVRRNNALKTLLNEK